MQFIRLPQVIEKTGLARATIYKYMANSSFPKQLALGGGNVAWLESEIHEWMLAKIEERDTNS